MKNQLNSTLIKMKIQMKSTRLPDLLAALFLSLTMLVTSRSKLEAAPNASVPANEPVKAKPFEGQIFRTADDRQAITLISQDELEMRGGDAGPDNLICKYTRQDDTLRVVKTMLGTTLAVYYKITPEGLKANDGTVLFNPAKFLFAQADSLLGSGNKKNMRATTTAQSPITTAPSNSTRNSPPPTSTAARSRVTRAIRTPRSPTSTAPSISTRNSP